MFKDENRTLHLVIPYGIVRRRLGCRRHRLPGQQAGGEHPSGEQEREFHAVWVGSGLS